MSCFEGVKDGVESLHVKVMKVARDSPARKDNVHCQMYLKSLALSTRPNGQTFPAPLIIGATMCRRDKTPRQLEDEIWRCQSVDDTHCVDVDKLMGSVDAILSRAYMSNKSVSVELVEYIE